jgi:hypothetical protein
MNTQLTLRRSLGSNQISFAAGSTSLDPYGYRILDVEDGNRLSELTTAFPSLIEYLNAESLVISAYPAALGIHGFAPFVDTYLHPPTFIRAMRLASLEQRRVVLASQPLTGAELLLRMLDSGFELPAKMLWAVGGYFLPKSLEKFMRERLAIQGCRITVLQCYGIAEIGHTCFAALDRDASGSPKYRLVAGDVGIRTVPETEELILHREGREVNTQDRIFRMEDFWKIENDPKRLSAKVREELESWTENEWQRRTGYLRSEKGNLSVQLRESAEQLEANEVAYFRFWERFGGSPQTKPLWSEW